MVCLCNETPIDQYLEMGDVLAESVPPPEGLCLLRRGRHPVSGDMPEILQEFGGKLSEARYEDPYAASVQRSVSNTHTTLPTSHTVHIPA